MEATKTLRLAEFPNASLETFAAIINNITAHKTFISQYSSNLSITLLAIRCTRIPLTKRNYPLL